MRCYATLCYARCERSTRRRRRRRTRAHRCATQRLASMTTNDDSPLAGTPLAYAAPLKARVSSFGRAVRAARRGRASTCTWARTGGRRSSLGTPTLLHTPASTSTSPPHPSPPPPPHPTTSISPSILHRSRRAASRRRRPAERCARSGAARYRSLRTSSATGTPSDESVRWSTSRRRICETARDARAGEESAHERAVACWSPVYGATTGAALCAHGSVECSRSRASNFVFP